MFESNSCDSQLRSRYAHDDFSYGGYPDTSAFHRGVGSLDLLRALRSSRQAQRPLSLAVRLPLQRALSHGRETCSTKRIDAYLQRLDREIELVGCHLGQQQSVEQFHLAGGSTPNADQLRQLMSHLHKRFGMLDYDSGDYRIEIEQTHSDWPTMGLLRELGFNHVSIGVADLDAGRCSGGAVALQNPSPIRSLIDAARALHFRSVNIDLGYGRSWQTQASFARKVAAIIELQPSRVSVFDYAHPPQRYWPQRRFAARSLSALEDKLAMRQHCIEQLSLAGYRYLGMGMFVLPEDDLAIAQESGQLRRNCLGYSRHAHPCDQIGLGVAAVSQVGDLYVQNARDLQRYQAQLDMGQLPTCRGLLCGPDDQLRRALIDALICNVALDLRSIEARFGVVLRDYFAASWPLLEQMALDGLIVLSDDWIQVLPAGRLMIGAVCRVFEHSLVAPHSNCLHRPER